METLEIEILEPKAKKLLMDLMDLNLIRISKSNTSKETFLRAIKKGRKKEAQIPSLDEIQKEVKIVRKQMSLNK